ncbi:hypothetical protein GCM10008170_33090 [Methylopila capsulata]|uniref:Uncharacterized protein n=1 Tax=Methylopila capsulata TaxID=61654 RepID=A0A9W6IXB4_9HYPH|nr:hypothetical protein GCM10008170_33090 [Methylopila capsulata]
MGFRRFNRLRTALVTCFLKRRSTVSEHKTGDAPDSELLPGGPVRGADLKIGDRTDRGATIVNIIYDITLERRLVVCKSDHNYYYTYDEKFSDCIFEDLHFRYWYSPHGPSASLYASADLAEKDARREIPWLLELPSE